MNKDIDERLLPKGEYRDALNIEVGTSNSDEVGTVQTTYGTQQKTFLGQVGNVCVGSIAYEKENKVIFFVSGVDDTNTDMDFIAEYDVDQEQARPILVDLWRHKPTTTSIMGQSSTTIPISTSGLVRKGMVVYIYNPSTGASYLPPNSSQGGVTTVVTGINGQNISISQGVISSVPSGTVVVFESRRTLKFDKDVMITGINVFDDMLMFTDGVNEPKKINITRCKAGTANILSHTNHMVDGVNQGPIREEDITVIKKNPIQPPSLTLSKTKREDINGGDVDLETTFDKKMTDGQGDPLAVGTTFFVTFTQPFPDYKAGDTLIASTSADDNNFDDEYDVRFKVISYSPGTGSCQVKVVSIGTIIPDSIQTWNVKLEQEDPLFEYKFPRFALRYKYEDGEYSAFSPFSEVAFLPGDFEYNPKKGFNLGMTNNCRSIIVGNILNNIPRDVIEVDVLYKESNSTNVYTVKTIKKHDPEWDPTNSKYNKLEIESEIIYATVPSNQLLRPYDNVPLNAIAQEFVGNRLIYGNYKQQFDLLDKYGNIITPEMDIEISPKDPTTLTAIRSGGVDSEIAAFDIDLDIGFLNVTITLTADDVAAFINETTNYQIGNVKFPVTGNGDYFRVRYFSQGNNETEIVIRVNDDGEITSYEDEGINENEGKPGKSIKTQRTYQLGVVYRDKYGRETPVQTNNTATSKLEKRYAENYNTIKAKINSLAPTFAESFKFFIKEPSNEYYNLAMDRWYAAEDGNIWLSFTSADRNKISEGDFIELKKRHAQDEAVKDPAKYKVLAISNEAPVFLKETKLSYGELEITNTDTSNNYQNWPVIQDGPPLPNNSFIIIRKDKFDDSSLKESLTDTSFLRYMRILGPTTNSNFYQILSISAMANGNYKINIKGKFKDDMNFTSASNQWPLIANLKLEITRKKLENKPEFQGRFFAKIYRDSVLQKHLLDVFKVDEETAQYKVITSRQVRYHNHSNKKSRSAWRSAPFGGGQNYEHWFIDRSKAAKGGRGIGMVSGQSRFDLSFSSVFPEGSSFDVGRTSSTLIEADFRNAMIKGAKFRWREDPDQTVYTITGIELKKCRNYRKRKSSFHYNDGSNKRARFKLTVTPNIGTGPAGYNPTQSGSWGAAADDYAGANAATFEFLQNYSEGDDFTTDQPAIWETEPKEDLNLDLYYEASEAYPIADHNLEKELTWFNCYSFANGVESNRIRDDFNAVTIDKGPKVSSVLAEQYKQETKGSGLIFSQIYNSTSGVNGLNQFIQAEAITKDLNPEFGTIQKLHARDSDLITLCEDKTLKILANKDALFEADGNTQLTANNNVLGQTVPYIGEYGISTNPESFVAQGFRAYFTDRQRGVVLRLSRNGLEPISEYGMKNYFRDNLATTNLTDKIIGSFDEVKANYNVSLPTETVSFAENVKGWVSRKSFVPESAASLNNKYLSFNGGELFQHHVDTVNRNFFYHTQYDSSITTILNEAPGSWKSFKTINYEGSQSRVLGDNPDTDGLLYNLSSIDGWYVDSITTDHQTGFVPEFKEKEGKWFNYVKGEATTLSNLDWKEFSVQGLGIASSITGDTGITQRKLLVTAKFPN